MYNAYKCTPCTQHALVCVHICVLRVMYTVLREVSMSIWCTLCEGFVGHNVRCAQCAFVTHLYAFVTHLYAFVTHLMYTVLREVSISIWCTRGGGLGSSTIFKNLMSPTPRRNWYLTTGCRAHYMVLDPIPQPLPVHFFGSRPQPPTSHS